MNTTTIDITGNEPINITPMTPLEAMECDAALHQHLDSADKHLDSAGALLLDMKRREGWKALNFGTWTEYLESRAVRGKSRRRALELLQAEEVRENLAMCGIPHMDIPTVTSQLTVLAQLPPSQQAEALQKADSLALAEGKKRTGDHVAKAVKKIKSLAQETAALGKSLELGGSSVSPVFPETDRTDGLTHTSPADVDDTPGAAPAPQQLKRKDVTVLEPATAAQPTDNSESARAESGAIATSVSAMLPEILADDAPLLDEDSPALTPAQMVAAREKIAYLVEALKEVQSEISQLKSERDSLDVECQALHAKNGDLHNEIAYLKTELGELKAQLQLQANA